MLRCGVLTEAAAVGLFGSLLLASVGVGEGLWRLGWPAESSRRAVHVLVGLATAASPLWFESPRGIAVLAAGFLVANAVALGRGWLPSVHAVDRRSWGTVTFPLALLVALALCWGPLGRHVVALQAAFAGLALADPAASWVGTRLRRPGRYQAGGAPKSVAGSLAFAVVAFVVTCLVLHLGTEAGGAAGGGAAGGGAAVVGAGVAVAALATVAEALGRSGWDNLWVVLAVIVPLAWLDGGGAAGLALAAVGAAAGFGWATWRVGALDLSGALAGSLLAWGLVAVGGPAWAGPALAFFVLSSALSRVGRGRKARAEARAQKGSRRDAAQVMANGGAGLAVLAASAFVSHDALYWAFVASFAAAAADTWGTEVGTWVGGPTRRLGVGRVVAPGTSGGMSAAGTLASLAGAASVVAPAVWLGPAAPASIGSGGLGAVVVGVALGAAVLDSVLGATLQVRYRLPDGSLTERREAGGVPLPRAAGLRWLDNDGVNAACTVAAAVVVLAVVLAVS